MAESKCVEQSRINITFREKRCRNSHPLMNPHRQRLVDPMFTHRTENITVRRKIYNNTIEILNNSNNIALKIHVRYTNGNLRLGQLFSEMHGELKDEHKKRELKKLTKETFKTAFSKSRKSPVAVFFTWGKNSLIIERWITERVCRKITKLMLYHPKFVGKSPVFFARCTTCRKIHHVRDM